MSFHKSAFLGQDYRLTKHVLSVIFSAACILVSNAQSAASNELESKKISRSVSEFYNSMGVCIHHSQGVLMETYIEPLRYLGVPNIRDDFRQAEGYIFLHQKLGTRSNIIVNPADLEQFITGARQLAERGALLAIEGANEPNNFPIKYNGEIGGGIDRFGQGLADWTPVAKLQRDLYRRVKSDAVLKKYPVFNVSEVGAQSPNVGLQYLEIPLNSESLFPAGTKFADFLNVHNYVSGIQGQYVANQAWKAADPTTRNGWDGLFGNHSKLWGKGYAGYDPEALRSIPRVTTETGWDSIKNHGGEQTQGKMLLNTYLSQFANGYSHTFIYQLRDGEGGVGNQGLFNKDSSPKLAATYIHNLTNIIPHYDEISKPSEFFYKINQRSEFVHDLVLQSKSDEFFIIIWGERIVGSEFIRVEFPRNFASIDVFDPTIADTSLKRLSNVDVAELSVSDHPLILKITR